MEHRPNKTEKTPAPLPEVKEANEMRESENYDYGPSAELWYWNMVDGNPFDTKRKAELIAAQKEETPYLVSGVLERACNLQCAHCLYQDEKSSAAQSEEHHLDDTIRSVVSQLPEASPDYKPKFMSVGRILRPAHLELFTSLRGLRPDVGLGVIDNGTYTKLLPKWPAGFKFDWIDISIDGTEEHHNEQRASARAYAEAMEGLRHAREVTRSPEEGGYVSSLITLTNINAGDVAKVADLLLVPQENGLPLVDELNLTTTSPTNAVNAELEMSVEDFSKAWADLVEVSRKYNTDGKERVKLGIYRVEDVEKLAAVVGEKKFLEVFTSDEEKAGEQINIKGNFITTHIDGVAVSYLPLSIWPPEEFLIEADGAYRTAYEGKFTLEELQKGVSKDGVDTRPFTVTQLTPESRFRESFEKAVDHYWAAFGSKRLDEEFAAFSRIRAKAQLQ